MYVVIFNDDNNVSAINDKTSYKEENIACHKYKKKYGLHFNEKLVTFAVSNMRCYNSSTGELELISPISKSKLDSMLLSNNIIITKNHLCDYIYVANMCKAGFFGSSIIDEKHLCLYVKDVIDDPDGYDGLVFNRWCADMHRQGLPIDWDKFI